MGKIPQFKNPGFDYGLRTAKGDGRPQKKRCKMLNALHINKYSLFYSLFNPIFKPVLNNISIANGRLVKNDNGRPLRERIRERERERKGRRRACNPICGPIKSKPCCDMYHLWRRQALCRACRPLFDHEHLKCQAATHHCSSSDEVSVLAGLVYIPGIL